MKSWYYEHKTQFCWKKFEFGAFEKHLNFARFEGPIARVFCKYLSFARLRQPIARVCSVAMTEMTFDVLQSKSKCQKFNDTIVAIIFK